MASKQALLEEFSTIIAPQKTGLAARLPQLFAQYYAPPAELPVPVQQAVPPAVNGAATAATFKPAQSAVKRGGPELMATDSKRLKAQPSLAGDDPDKKADGIWKDLMNLIMKKFWHKKECAPFKEPVDPVKLHIPDYFNYIKEPMDLGTVKKKLSERKYNTPQELCRDVRLVWSNCATYNAVGTPVRKSGDLLADVWEKSWAEGQFEERWNEVQFLRNPATAVPYKVNQLNNQIKSAVNQLPATMPNGQVMSDLEKRRLSIAVSELQGEQLNQLLILIQDDLPPSSADEEVELDLDQLPHEVLMKMYNFVSSLQRQGPPQQPQQTPSQRHISNPGPAKQDPSLQASGMMHLHHHQQPPIPAQQPQQPAQPSQPAAQQPSPYHQQSQPQQQLPAQPQEDLEQQPELQPQDMGTEGDSQFPVDSGQGSPGNTVDSHDEVKGSTLDDPHQRGNMVLSHVNRTLGADESATVPKPDSNIIRDRGAGGGARKSEVALNTAWGADLGVDDDEEGGGEAGEGDEEDQVWLNYKNQEEQRRQQAEEQRKLKEQQEEEMRKKQEAEAEEARRAAAALEEEEQRIAEEQQRQRMEQCDKEVDEIKARQGTANLVSENELPSLLGQAAEGGDLEAVGLTYKNDDDDVDFDD